MHFIEPSFAFGAPLSLILPHCSLFSFALGRVCARLQTQGLAQGTEQQYSISPVWWLCTDWIGVGAVGTGLGQVLVFVVRVFLLERGCGKNYSLKPYLFLVLGV